MAGFRYSKLGYVAFNVTDLDRSIAFYTDTVGLDLTARENGVAFLRCSQEHHDVVLYEAREPGVKRIGWELGSDADLDRAWNEFSELGLDTEEVGDNELALLGQGRSFRVREPHTRGLFEYYAAVQTTVRPFEKRIVDIESLGHILLGAPEFKPTVEGLTRDFNFRLSDSFGEKIAFMRCFPNPMHHSFGVCIMPEPQFHHLTFMVSHVDEIGRSYNRLRKAEVPIVYGPGRHPPSGSFFLYFLDPDGMTLEYSHGMEEFPEEGARKPRIFEPVPESLDFWGGIPESRFAAVGSVEGA